jgi:hypothetical protein
MSQQLLLFSNDLCPDDSQDLSSDLLLEQTRELFQHQGSTSELIERIMTAIHVLDELCNQSDAE